MLSWSTTSFLRIVLVLAALTAAGSASARPKEFDRHVTEAQQSYTEKNYDKAVEEFEAAYQISPEPVLLISIGRCHYLADRPKEALTYYNQALQGKLTRSEREEVTASVAKATIKLQEQERKRAEDQRAADQAKISALAVQATPAPKAPEKKPFYKTGWFWGTIGGVVGASVIVGVTVGLLTRSPSSPQMPTTMSPPDGATVF